MGPLITRAGKIRILIVAIACVAIWPFTPAGRQQRNMHLAAIYAVKLREIIGNNPQISRLELEPYTGAGGSLMVNAVVDNEKTEEELKKIVAESNPPVRVVFEFITTAQLKSSEQPSKSTPVPSVK
jgi:hypothetical protein